MKYNKEMFLDVIIQPFAYLSYQLVKQKEKKLGYKLRLPHSPHFISGTMIFDMTPVWRRAGIDAKGVNYFIIGRVENGISSRFDEKFPYYQAWLGGYIVQFADERNWSVKEHTKLGIEDQKNWLRLYGDKNPIVETDVKSIKKLTQIKISGYAGTLYEGCIWSDTDVGDGKESPLFPYFMAGFAYHFNKSNSQLNLSWAHFIPKWSDQMGITPYQKIYLRGYVIIVDINTSIKAILYANGAQFRDKNGRQYDTFKQIQKELLKLLKNISIEKA